MERGPRVSQGVFNAHCGRVRATQHTPRGPFQFLEPRHGIAEIVERRAGVHRNGTVTTTFRGTFNHKDGVAKDEFVLVETIDSPCKYTGRGESDLGKYAIEGEITDAELDSAGLRLRKLV